MARAALLLVLSAMTTSTPATAGAGQQPPLRDRLVSMIAQNGAEVAVAFRTVDGRDEVMIDADEEFHAASTMKVPVMVELFRQAAAGTLSLDDRVTVVNEFRSVVDGSPYSLRVGDDSDADIYAAVGTPRTYRQLCEAMITVSSNLATNLLVTRLGAEAVQQTMGRYGAGGMRVRRGVEDGKAFRAGLNNTATARAYAAILAAIAKGETVSAAASAEMVEILKRQKFRAGIPAGLPPDVPVGNKTGTITRIHHDGAIVLGPRPYVLVVLTRGFADEKSSDALIARITGEIHATVH